MELNERIKTVRTDAGVSQREFSERINISQGTLALFESGKRMPRDIHIAAICRTFRVNAEWLRYGKGEMRSADGDDSLNRLLADYHLDPLAVKMVEMFVTLPESEMKWVLSKVRQLAKEAVVDEDKKKSGESVCVC